MSNRSTLIYRSAFSVKRQIVFISRKGQQRCPSLQQLENTNTSFSFICKTAQFDVTALTNDGSGGGPSQSMPLLRKDIPVAEGHTSVQIFCPWSCLTGSTHITSAQLSCCRPTSVCHPAQRWTPCASLLLVPCRPVPSSNRHCSIALQKPRVGEHP